MGRRAKGVYVHRAPGRSACVVMVSEDQSESSLVARLMGELGSCVLVTYRTVEDLVLNAPHGPVSLVILAGEPTKEGTERSLRWLKRWQPSAALAVVGEPGGQDVEMAARMAGASYFVRPVAELEWQAILAHVIEKTTRSVATIQPARLSGSDAR